MREPTFSPWGEVQSCDTLYPGMFLVTTPGHGGIMVESQAVFFLSTAARKCGFREAGFLCFEEDSQEDVVLRELLDKRMWKIPERISDPAVFEQAINESLQRWNPEYWAARESGTRRYQNALRTAEQKISLPAERRTPLLSPIKSSPFG